MNYKKAYRCKADLKMLREEMNLSKEFVANEIGYSVRNLERIEKNNAVASKEAACRICTLYKFKYEETFVIYDDRNHMERVFKNIGKIPQNQIRQNETYYLLYINYQDLISIYLNLLLLILKEFLLELIHLRQF